MTVELIRTTGLDPRSEPLRNEMDAETFALYGDYFTGIGPEELERLETALHTDQADLVHVVIALEDGVPVGHAALRPLTEGFEVKKVFVQVPSRGRGISKALMAEVEQIARELGETELKLQTGEKQHAAIALYAAIGYVDIPSFGPYEGLDDLVFMGKTLR